MTGFMVVPTGNVIYARPDYVEDPLVCQPTAPTAASPSPTRSLAPEAIAADRAGQRDGDLNRRPERRPQRLPSPASTRLRPQRHRPLRPLGLLCRLGSLPTKGPVVIVALPGTPQRDPITGVVTQQTFVLQAPAGSDPVVNDGSALRPRSTPCSSSTPGSTLKLQNASSSSRTRAAAIQVLGGANPDDPGQLHLVRRRHGRRRHQRRRQHTRPRAAATGAASSSATSTHAPPAVPIPFPVDGTLKGPNGGGRLRRRRRPVDLQLRQHPLRRRCRARRPRASGTTPSRSSTAVRRSPTPIIARTGGAGSVAGGHLRRPRLVPRGRPRPRPADPPDHRPRQISINGIWVRPELTGVAEQTDAESSTPTTPSRSAASATSPSTTPCPTS